MRRANTPTPKDVLCPRGEDIVHTISNNGEIYDVGSSHPGAGEGPKGLAVRQLKRYVSWVQTVYALIIISLSFPRKRESRNYKSRFRVKPGMTN
jgi:hypothetical protein